ncbi:efflux RND transporter permease subunit, partial [Campylobacter coli]|nr:efflux RND transporter permease subunit [Campylobacter coli]
STSVFSSGVAYILKRTIRFVLVFCIMIGFIAYLFKIVPSSLVPSEDQGVIMSIINLPSGSSIHRTIEEVDTINKNATQMKEISSSVSLIGFDLFTSSLKENAAAVFFKLKDWSQREASSDQIIAQLFGQYAADRNALSYFLNLPPIPGLSLTGGFEMYAQNKSGKDYDAIQQDVNKMLELARTRKELANVRTTLDTSFPQYKLIIDRDKMKYYNLNMQDVFNTISATIGTYYVNDFPMLGKNFQVN